MNTALPVRNAANLTTNQASPFGTAVRAMLASVLTAILKHSRPLDDSKALTFVAADETAVQERAEGGIKMVFSRMSESSEQRALRLQMADLAEATDLYDLEFRSRAWDRKTRSN